MPIQGGVELIPLHFSGKGFSKDYIYDSTNQKFVLEVDFYHEEGTDSLYTLGTRISATNGRICEIRCNNQGPPSFKERFERLPEKVKQIALNGLDNPAKGLLAESIK